VAADHPLASQAGVDALRQGGNVVDAACATALTLGVVSPASSGIGGGGFMLLHLARDHKVVALDFRERAPDRATRTMFVRDGKAVPDLAAWGGLAVGVPGEIAGLSLLVEKYGRLGWRRCVEPAARLARAGFPVSHFVATRAELLSRRPGVSAEMRALIAPAGHLLADGQPLVRPELAGTLDVLARDPQSFYRGEVGRQVAAAVQKAGGLITEADLADYRPQWRTPLEATYRGHRVVSMPPPSSGGIALIQTLNILERSEVGKLDFGSSTYLHLLTEALKHAFADRARFLGDPDFVKVPLAHLASKDYAGELARRIRPDAVAPLERYGTPSEHASRLNDAGTSHISILTTDGDAVALTTTINGYFGARFVAGSTGIILNNEMDDFTPLPGVANLSDLVTGEANAIAPGKRPLSSMTPTMVLAGERPIVVAGGSGSPRIITGTLQALLAVLDFGLDPQTAVSAARIHTQWRPDKLYYERFIPADVVAALARRGHKTERDSEGCNIQVVQATASGLEAASDPRKGGAPAGF
jgi:gamma-glutamyltranspeptidase/glutathione hydrolase